MLTRSVIFDRVWGFDFGPSSNSLEVYVGYLRRKVDAEMFLAPVESAKLRGAWTDPAAGRTTFKAWLEEWWGGAADLRPSTPIQRLLVRPWFETLLGGRYARKYGGSRRAARWRGRCPATT